VGWAGKKKPSQNHHKTDKTAPSVYGDELSLLYSRSSHSNKQKCLGQRGMVLLKKKRKVPAATGQGLIKRKKCLRQGACNK
jgi:hypothetical protein